ncbi:transcriptional regulator XRE family [Clostridium sp. CAG:967]|nr:transcriptional regulator XRE family [Clostridium sp. CAG:967]
MSNIKYLLGKRIKEIRLRRKYTQEKLAEMSNIEIPSLSNIENGKNYPNSETLLKISNALDVRPFELFMFDYYLPKEIMIEEMINLMQENEDLAQKMYKYFLCIK